MPSPVPPRRLCHPESPSPPNVGKLHRESSQHAGSTPDARIEALTRRSSLKLNPVSRSRSSTFLAPSAASPRTLNLNLRGGNKILGNAGLQMSSTATAPPPAVEKFRKVALRAPPCCCPGRPGSIKLGIHRPPLQVAVNLWWAGFLMVGRGSLLLHPRTQSTRLNVSPGPKLLATPSERTPGTWRVSPVQPTMEATQGQILSQSPTDATSSRWHLYGG